MTSLIPWRGVRLRVFDTGKDADAPARRVAIPASWDEQAAAGFVGLIGPEARRSWQPARLPDEAERWIGPLDRAARADGASDGLATALHWLLLLRQAAPDAWAWRNEGAWRNDGAWQDGADRRPSFALHLAAFADPATGLDTASLDEATRTVAIALSMARARSGSRTASLRIAGLDGMLAALGLAYDSEAGRDIAADVLARLRASLRARDRGIELVAIQAGPADALLGVETAGIAAPFSPVTTALALTAASEARLAARGLSPERALALTLAGDPPLRQPADRAAAAMAATLGPLLDHVTPCIESAPPEHAADPRAARRPRRLPARAKGFTQKVTIGGQRIFLRTAEYTDGTLGEVSVTAGGSRALMDAVSAAISIGLQHGVPLAAFVDAFAHGRFGPQGVVEGDPAIATASSPLDYALRALSDAYDRKRVPDPAAAPSDGAADAGPLLPMALPTAAAEPSPAAARRHLRLVTAS